MLGTETKNINLNKNCQVPIKYTIFPVLRFYILYTSSDHTRQLSAYSQTPPNARSFNARGLTVHTYRTLRKQFFLVYIFPSCLSSQNHIVHGHALFPTRF